ncbi:uncharacterized protein ISCGN_006867 [Ixodes scapularis]
MEVRDIVISPPDQEPYEHLKRELIRRTTASEQRRLQQLLTAEELGDRKPSQLLRRMTQLLGSQASLRDSSLLRELFLQRLPSDVRRILETSSNIPLDDLAELADKILDTAPPMIQATTYTTTTWLPQDLGILVATSLDSIFFCGPARTMGEVLLTATLSSTLPGHLRENHSVYHGLCVNFGHVSAIPSAETTTKLPDLDSNMYGIGQPGKAPSDSLGACLQKPASQQGENQPTSSWIMELVPAGLPHFQLDCLISSWTASFPAGTSSIVQLEVG